MIFLGCIPHDVLKSVPVYCEGCHRRIPAGRLLEHYSRIHKITDLGELAEIGQRDAAQIISFLGSGGEA